MCIGQLDRLTKKLKRSFKFTEFTEFATLSGQRQKIQHMTQDMLSQITSIWQLPRREQPLERSGHSDVAAVHNLQHSGSL